MKVIFLEPAQNELDDSVIFYNQQLEGLGDKFLTEVFKAIDLIQKYPNAWQQLSVRIRRCLVKGFPYGVVYVISDNNLIIIAIANLHRKPNYWLDRLT
ncbi:plasmid stabilization system [Calothrix sp. PCC 7716]|nr:plasmid stabilization system [Calothrix sp. PCC 7716]